MNATTTFNLFAIYEGSNGEATQALYDHFKTLGPAGLIALNLFRAVKCSSRAKKYRRGAHRRDAYARKQFSLENLCRVLDEHAVTLGIAWGWQIDDRQPVHRWVLYVQTAQGQCSFHTDTQIPGPDFEGEWDRGSSAGAMVRFCQSVLNSNTPTTS